MRRRTLRSRIGGVAATLALGMVCAGCDPASEFADVKITVLVHADGSGTVKWSMPGGVTQRQVVELVSALGIPADSLGDRDAPRVLTALPSDDLSLDLANVSRHLSAVGLDDAQSVFVRICVPHGEGRMTGDGVDLSQWGSCASWLSDESGHDSGVHHATVHFGPRRHPASAWMLASFLLLLGGIALVILSWRSKRSGTSIVAAAACAFGALVCAVLTWRSITSLYDSSWDRKALGLDDLSSGFRRSLVVNLVATMTLGALGIATAVRGNRLAISPAPDTLSS